MKKHLAVLIAFFTSAEITAQTQSCFGKVQSVMDFPAKCNGHMAYTTDTTGGKWLCSISDNSDSMILMAAATNTTVMSRLNLQTPGDCTSFPEQYNAPAYISINVGN